MVDRVKKALADAALPDWVQSTSIEDMVDHTGDRAVRVVIVVHADRAAVVRDGAALNELSRRIHQAVDSAGVELFPYVRFTIAGEAA